MRPSVASMGRKGFMRTEARMGVGADILGRIVR